MKVGDYVRTKLGIAKIIDIKENPKGEKTIYCLDKDVINISECELGDMYSIINPIAEEVTNEFDINFGDEKQIIKSSPNIIDLIEVGDYVNGKEIDFIGKDGVYSDYDNAQYYYCEEKDIESIVTKEQFENMEYKIND